MPGDKDFNWNNVPDPDDDLTNLGHNFTEEEVKRTISDLPSDKAPEPDDFTGAFSKACWEVIKPEIVLVVNNFSNVHVANFH